jgi:hypothetical protein
VAATPEIDVAAIYERRAFVQSASVPTVFKAVCPDHVVARSRLAGFANIRDPESVRSWESTQLAQAERQNLGCKRGFSTAKCLSLRQSV